MAACGSLHHIFESPLPESPTLLQSLSPWKHLNSTNEDPPSFTEFFAELHFKENTDPIPLSSPPSSSSISYSSFLITGNFNKEKNEKKYIPRKYRHSDSFSSMNSESLSLCTEGLGFESCDDLEDPNNNHWKQRESRKSISSHSSNECLSSGELKRSRITGGELPPPISSIGRSGNPWVVLKSYRYNGRFVLKEVRIPTQEFLHACREDGRLKLQFIQSDDQIIEEEEDDDAGKNGEKNVEDK